MRLTLVRHGPPIVDPAVPAAEWVLDPGRRQEVLALRAALPEDAAWVSSPEPKAIATATALTDRPVVPIDDLCEAERPATWFDDPSEFAAAVRRAMEVPDVPATPGWEPASQTRTRVVSAVHALLADTDRPEALVLVGHGTAWLLLIAELTGRPPDLDGWERMAMPDLAVLELSEQGRAVLLRDWGR